MLICPDSLLEVHQGSRDRLEVAGSLEVGIQAVALHPVGNLQAETQVEVLLSLLAVHLGSLPPETLAHQHPRPALVARYLPLFPLVSISLVLPASRSERLLHLLRLCLILLLDRKVVVRRQNMRRLLRRE